MDDRKHSNSGNFLETAGSFFSDIIDRIKKADRRLLIMIAAAVVLLIIVVALIIHGVGSKNNDTKVITPPEPSISDTSPSVTTTLPAAAIVSGAGNYTVSTNDDTVPLKMRLAASVDSSVVTKIPNGTSVKVLFVDDAGDDTEKGWGYVSYGSNRGWVSMDYLTPAAQ